MVKRGLLKTVQHTDGGIEYTISIYLDGPREFYGTWRCGVCFHEGGSSSRFSSEEEALVANRLNIGPHSTNHE